MVLIFWNQHHADFSASWYDHFKDHDSFGIVSSSQINFSCQYREFEFPIISNGFKCSDDFFGFDVYSVIYVYLSHYLVSNKISLAEKDILRREILGCLLLPEIR